MKKDWKEFLEIIALVAVVISLLMVAYQIRQANRIAIATVEIEASNNFSAFNEFMMSNPEVSQAARKANAGGELSDAERELLVGLSARALNLWRGLETAYKNDVLPESTYQIAFDEIRNVIERAGPERRRIWRQVLDNYPSLAKTEVFKAAYAALARAEATPGS